MRVLTFVTTTIFLNLFLNISGNAKCIGLGSVPGTNTGNVDLRVEEDQPFFDQSHSLISEGEGGFVNFKVTGSKTRFYVDPLGNWDFNPKPEKNNRSLDDFYVQKQILDEKGKVIGSWSLSPNRQELTIRNQLNQAFKLTRRDSSVVKVKTLGKEEVGLIELEDDRIQSARLVEEPNPLLEIAKEELPKGETLPVSAKSKIHVSVRSRCHKGQILSTRLKTRPKGYQQNYSVFGLSQNPSLMPSDQLPNLYPDQAYPWKTTRSGNMYRRKSPYKKRVDLIENFERNGGIGFIDEPEVTSERGAVD